MRLSQLFHLIAIDRRKMKLPQMMSMVWVINPQYAGIFISPSFIAAFEMMKIENESLSYSLASSTLNHKYS